MLPSLPLAVIGTLLAVAGVHALPQQETASSAAAGAPSPTPSSASSSATACNNSPSLCGRQYNNITFMGAHDSAFLRDDSTGNSLAGNQFLNATDALDAGIRMLQAQVHTLNSTLRLCHTSCDLLDAGSLEPFLKDINFWMGQNPHEVVTLLLVNSDSADVADFASAFEGSGISKYGFSPATPGATGDWPTLQSMIDQGTRLVSFVTNIDSSTDSPYLLDEFDYVFETSFEVTELSGFNCTLDRPSNAGDATTAISNNLLGLINHFKYQTLAADIFVPDVDEIDVVNSANTTTAGNLGLHLQTCNSEWGTVPNFVLVDFWDKGNTVEAADHINGVRAATGRTTVEEDDGSSGSFHGHNLRGVALVAFVAATLLLV